MRKVLIFSDTRTREQNFQTEADRSDTMDTADTRASAHFHVMSEFFGED
jgi:hypothetical protein